MKKEVVKEKVMQGVMLLCGLAAIMGVCTITVYMMAKGIPALGEIKISHLIFGTKWAPTAQAPSFGIGYIIITSIIGTTAAVLLGVPVALFTGIFLSELAGKKVYRLVSSAVELLAAIPSVIYGLIGMMVLNPQMYRLEKLIFTGSKTHQFTGGANLLSAVLVLAVMILPTVVSVSTSSLKMVSDSLRASSIALGATRLQTIFGVVIPAAKSGIMTGVVLGIGRALGEAMAINMVSGGSVNLPLPFNSVRTLTTQIVSEMGYASGLHREVLFTVGLILYIFIVITNLIVMRAKKRGIEG